MEKTNEPKRCIVGIGSVFAETGISEFTAYAIGSCIVLCLYETEIKAGAMAHILLPSASFTGHKNVDSVKSAKYADHALDTALDKLLSLGAKKNKIRAAIIGGAEMFPLGKTKILNIGKMNTESVTEELCKRDIPLIYSDTGGNKSRTVTFRIPGNDFYSQITVKSPPHLSKGI